MDVQSRIVFDSGVLLLIPKEFLEGGGGHYERMLVDHWSGSNGVGLPPFISRLRLVG